MKRLSFQEPVAEAAPAPVEMPLEAASDAINFSEPPSFESDFESDPPATESFSLDSESETSPFTLDEPVSETVESYNEELDTFTPAAPVNELAMDNFDNFGPPPELPDTLPNLGESLTENLDDSSDALPSFDSTLSMTDEGQSSLPELNFDLSDDADLLPTEQENDLGDLLNVSPSEGVPEIELSPDALTPDALSPDAQGAEAFWTDETPPENTPSVDSVVDVYESGLEQFPQDMMDGPHPAQH